MKRKTAGLGKYAAECANFINRGCVMRINGRCHVTDGEQCSYFELAVLPWWLKRGGEDADKLADGYAPAEDVPLLKEKRKKGRRCECGATLPRRRRVCDACREKHRRASYRGSKRKARSLSTVSGNGDVVSPYATRG